MQISPERSIPAAPRLLLALLGAALAGCAPREAPPVPEPPRAEAARPTPRRSLIAARLGVILPGAGSEYLQQYAAGILEGVQVAAAEVERDSTYRIELIVRNAGTPAAAAAAVRELAAQGVGAVIGPLIDEDVAAAAAARPDSGLAIISPTATGRFTGLAQVYALNAPDTLGAHELARLAARRGYARVAVLRARSGAAVLQARAFSGTYAAASGRAPLEVVFDPGTTTFGAVLRRLRDARVDAFFLAAEEREVRQLLPQVQYYGLGETQILASGGWATPDGIEGIGLGVLENVIIALPFLAADSAGGWQRFVRQYEALHRRTLESAIPALGYDAARLALAGLGARGPGAAAASAALTTGAPVAGATGELLPRRGGVLRRPVLVRVRDGRIIPIS